jgi:hypothetical protein
LDPGARFRPSALTAPANLEGLPMWNKGDEFVAVREKSGVK